MTGYVRPALSPLEFRDASGRVIEYGRRWGEASPPEYSYSVTSNLERFAPLHVVADALIAYLVDAYDAEVSEDVAFAKDLHHDRDDVIRAVRLIPNEPAAARLTFVFTSFPSVLIHAGLLHTFLYPVCGCDACDETWEAQADEMEWQVLAVVGGRYRERVNVSRRLGVEYRLETADGSGRVSGEALTDEYPAERIIDAARRLRALPGGWLPWPERAAP